MPSSKRATPPASDLPPHLASDLQRAIAIVVQVRQELTRQTERLDQLEAELRLLVDVPPPPPVPLTPREVVILHAAAIGHTNAEIADQQGIAEGTLRTRLGEIYRKLDVRNRTEAAFTAWKLGLI